MQVFQKINPLLLAVGLPITLMAITILVAFNLNFSAANNSYISIAITADLLFTIPLVYLFLIYKKPIPKLSVMPFFVIGLVTASFVIPNKDNVLLPFVITWILPLIELTVLSVIFYKIRQIRKSHVQKKANGASFYDALNQSTAEFLPKKAAAALSIEVSLIYYTFFTWKKPRYKTNEFTYHKDTGILVTLITLLTVAIIELFSVHLLLAKNYTTLSWVLTAISSYGIIQILGLIKSIPRRPYIIENGYLIARLGVFQETRICLTNIKEVEITMADYPKEDLLYKKITLFEHNCIIHLNKEAFITGFLGAQKPYLHLAINIDNKQKFKTQLLNEIQTSQTYQSS